MTYCSIYVTAANRDEALAIGRAVVAARLAACANVLDGVTSVYHWQGRLEEDTEAVLILKTRRELVQAAIECVDAAHDDDVPCAVVWEIVGGNAAYLDWIGAETAAALNA